MDQVVALEANLRLFETRVIELREFMRRSPGFKGDWTKLQVWKECRRQYRILDNTALPILRRKQNGRG